MKDIILGSASPRRRQLMELTGLKFYVDEPAAGEISLRNPADMAKENARLKALDVAKRRNGIIIGADTVVSHNGEALGKPKNQDDALYMLKRLCGERHTVYTGLYIIDTFKGQTCAEVEATDVFFANVSDESIMAYIKTGEPMDKAGAYGIQGRWAPNVIKICGDYFNVVGLPLHRLTCMLREVGIDM
ncbi:MAG: Maf family protein [Christensenellales bacterium]|jgi:septum formation protein